MESTAATDESGYMSLPSSIGRHWHGQSQPPADPPDDELLSARAEISELLAELQRSERRTQIAMEMLNEGVLIFDQAGRVVYVNNAASRILSASFDQLIARHARDRRWRFVKPDGTKLSVSSHPAISTLQSGRSHRDVTMGVPKPSGETTWISVCSRAVPDERGLVDHVIVTFTDITERRIILEQLEHQAHHDQLTNLANRRLFHLELGRAISRSRRSGCAVALVYMDLNGFKQINDTLGHQTGDLVLCTIAQRLTAAMRSDELISRYGGDEFVALLSMLRHPREAIDVFTERMREALNEPVKTEAGPITVGASFGSSVYPHHGRTTEQLLSHADQAMFAMKTRLVA
jgi:diguanylate cyclase (GGDEF)-like protein/PAS domain S-box-containing protein